MLNLFITNRSFNFISFIFSFNRFLGLDALETTSRHLLRGRSRKTFTNAKKCMHLNGFKCNQSIHPYQHSLCSLDID